MPWLHRRLGHGWTIISIVWMDVLLIPALFPILVSLISYDERGPLIFILMVKPDVDVAAFASSSVQFTFSSVLLWSGKGHFYPDTSGAPNRTIAPVTVKQPWAIWANRSQEYVTNWWCDDNKAKRLNYLSIPKLQRRNHWSLGMDK